MATRIITETTCDLTGSADATTHTITVDGVSYEVELSDKAFKDTIGKVVDVARLQRRTIPGGVRRDGSAKAATLADRAESMAMRQWLRAEGHDVKDRGRVDERLRALWQNRNVASVTPIKTETAPAKATKKAAKRAPAALLAPAKPKTTVSVPLAGASKAAAIRAWAAKQTPPIKVPSTGRIKPELREAWEAAGSPTVDDLRKA